MDRNLPLVLSAFHRNHEAIRTVLLRYLTGQSGDSPEVRPDGHLLLYRPFSRAGRHTAPSNTAFDSSLRQANPEWGVRGPEALERLAADVDMQLVETVAMPANNLILVFERQPASRLSWPAAHAGSAQPILCFRKL